MAPVFVIPAGPVLAVHEEAVLAALEFQWVPAVGGLSDGAVEVF
jgi:hypothetical protein